MTGPRAPVVSQASALVTSSATMRKALDELVLAASTDAPILLHAEVGSDEVALGRLVHENSPRRGGRYLALSCSSLSDLSRPQRIAVPGGSLFLLEIGTLAPPFQARLVQLLDERDAPRHTTRIIAATTSDLHEDVAAGRFSRELLFRLSVIEIRIPPLRERPEDILSLARDLIASLSVDLGRRAPELSDEAAALLLEHRWPANVRELKNVLEQALLCRRDDVIHPEALREVAVGVQTSGVGGNITLRNLEREHILRVMTRAPSLRVAAATLGVSRSTLRRWRRVYQRIRDAELGAGR